MVGITDRNRKRLELVSAGYTLGRIDEDRPRTILYRHKPSYNTDGGISQEIGSTSEGVPGTPDYILRKARIGLFERPPSENCECRWCVERNVVVNPVTEAGEAFTDEESVNCQACGERVSALTKAGAISRLRVHMKAHEVAV
jgi:hypothetical protein